MRRVGAVGAVGAVQRGVRRRGSLEARLRHRQIRDWVTMAKVKFHEQMDEMNEARRLVAGLMMEPARRA